MAYDLYYYIDSITSTCYYSGSDFTQATKKTLNSSEYAFYNIKVRDIVPLEGGTPVKVGSLVFKGVAYNTDLLNVDFTLFSLEDATVERLTYECPNLNFVTIGTVGKFKPDYGVFVNCGNGSSSENSLLQVTFTDGAHIGDGGLKRFFAQSRYTAITMKYDYAISTLRNCFVECNYLKAVDLTGLNLTNVVSGGFYNAFSLCPKLKTVRLGVIRVLDSTDYEVFHNTSSELVYDEVVNIEFSVYSGTSLKGFFSYNAFPILKLKIGNAHLVTNFSNMFSNSARLKELDLTDVDFSNANNTGGMFQGSKYLASVKFDKVGSLGGTTSSTGVFSTCGDGNGTTPTLTLTINEYAGSSFYSLFRGANYTNINFIINKLSSTSDTFNFGYAASYCSKLKELTFNLPKNTEMKHYVLDYLIYGSQLVEHITFSSAHSLKTNTASSLGNASNPRDTFTLTVEDSKDLTILSRLFYGFAINYIKLDLFTSKLTDVTDLFVDSSVTTIESDNFPLNGQAVFYNNKNLVGGNGTTFLSLAGDTALTYLSDKYAKADGGSSNPGLFIARIIPNTVTVVQSPKNIADIEVITSSEGATFNVTNIKEGYEFYLFYYTYPDKLVQRGRTENLEDAKVIFTDEHNGEYIAQFIFLDVKASEDEYTKGEGTLPDLVIDSDVITPDYNDDWIRRSSGGMYGVFIPDENQLNNFADFIYNESFTTAFVSFLQNAVGFNIKISDLVMSYNIFPFVISTQTNPKSIRVGWFKPSDGNLNPVNMYYTTINYHVIDCGSVHVEPVYNNFLDYKCSIEIYLPYIGYQNLEVYDVIGKNINPVYYVDLLTGNCVCLIKIDGSVKYQFTGQCGYSIPVASSDQQAIISKSVATATMLATAAGVVPPVVTSTATAVTATSPSSVKYNRNRSQNVTSVSKSGSSSEQQITRRTPAVTPREVIGDFTNIGNGITRGGNVTGNTGFVSVQTPFLEFSYPNLDIPNNYGHLNGYPCNKYLNIGNCKGYTQVGEIHLSGIPCTSAELEEIEQLLKGGIYL